MKRISSDFETALGRNRGAIPVIKEKIEHYKKTGNTRKLAIYESKLDYTNKAIATLSDIKKQINEKVKQIKSNGVEPNG